MENVGQRRDDEIWDWFFLVFDYLYNGKLIYYFI